MPTIKYLLQSKSKTSSIYMRLSVSRNLVFYKKTGLYVDPGNWNKEKEKVKGETVKVKNLNTKLRHLKNYILDELNNLLGDYSKLNSDWLGLGIDQFFNRATPKNDIKTFTGYGKRFLERLDYKVTSKGEKGVSIATKKKYKTIINKIAAYEKHTNSRVFVKDVDLDFREEIIRYFKDIDNLGDNSIGRYLKFIKTICLDAAKNKIKVSADLVHFKGYTIEVDSPFLSFEEIDKIKQATLYNENHIICKDWLLIGCYTGQRVSDLLRMDKTFIRNIQDFEFIVLKQTKTRKIVQIPIHEEVDRVLKKYGGGFPPAFTSNTESNKTMFNRYIKQVCKLSGITNIVEGNLFDPESKRSVYGSFEKYKLISSHICRRSFATNFYGNPKYPTPLLMNVTGHSTEKQFLQYVKKKPIDHSLQLAQIFQQDKKEPKSVLNIVKTKASNE